MFSDDPFEGLDQPVALTTLHAINASADLYRPLTPEHEERVRRTIRAALRPLERTLIEVAALNTEERIGLCEWLGGMLHRPPLERPTAAYRPMRAFVEALWWDLASQTPDPLGTADSIHPRLADNHPWGEGPES
jgi:hypothetical protein